MKTILLAAGLTFCAVTAQAATYDFIDAIDGAGGPINESIWDDFDTGNFAYFAGPSISLTGTANGAAAFAYADAGTAGFGVCRKATSASAINVAKPTNGNVCNPGSDDSIQKDVGEILQLTSNEDNVLITSITINANHDGNLADGDKVNIDGTEITLTAADLTTIGNKTYYTHNIGRVFNIGEMVTVASAGPHLYLSGVELSAVPLPAPALMLLTGVGAFGAMRRRKKRAAAKA